MKTGIPNITGTILLAASMGLYSTMTLAQHSHLNAGAMGTHQNSILVWANAAEFTSSSQYIKTLTHTNSGRYAGYYQGGITPTALPTTAAFGGPDPSASAPGSHLQMELICLAAPSGGRFGFWEAGSPGPTVTLEPGQTSTHLFPLSESDGSPGSDPFGHIHGRRFTATLPGIYQIGFRAIDTSTNGVGGGPIHKPSEVLPVWFQAGVNIQTVEPDEQGGHVHVKFGAMAGLRWQLETTRNLSTNSAWTKIGNAIEGNDSLVEISDPEAPEGRRFYRVVGSPVTQ